MLFAESYTARQVLRVVKEADVIESVHALGVLSGGREVGDRLETPYI